ncbi:bifunctional DNA primase/polymerase [Couchioplanes azureus]|uniref:bifunctional DNA primase/polymerase n=1 Tax=Couchioplanes caeruleus TaxID=56438 RepID=UPI001E33DAE5|nr:bifunctional DNA primase/polymerase [Couchioplanes caeruleus]
MLDAALAYARHGIPVLPVHSPAPDGSCSCGRARCDRPGKHPRLRHGLTEASVDPHRIAQWWSRWPDANVGLHTGIVMDVADVDSAEGWHALRHLLGGELPAGPQVRTGGGGWHFWFRPADFGNRVHLLPGVDWRGRGGYVIAPPSRHARGTFYYWVVRPGPEPPAAPDALRELIAGPDPPAGADAPLADLTMITHPGRYAAAALEAETHRVAYAAVGTRNDTLNRAAFALGRLVGAGMLDVATVTRELRAAGAWAGLGRDETVRTIRSGLDAGRRSPRTPAGTPLRTPPGTPPRTPPGAPPRTPPGAPPRTAVDDPPGTGRWPP